MDYTKEVKKLAEAVRQLTAQGVRFDIALNRLFFSSELDEAGYNFFDVRIGVKSFLRQLEQEERKRKNLMILGSFATARKANEHICPIEVNED